MPIYTIKYLSQRLVATATIELIFEKPNGFQFEPGQYGGFTLPRLMASQPTLATRRFSFLSTPDEPYLRIATRMQTSPYKQALSLLTEGDTIKLAGPTGQFVCHPDVNVPVVMIAGGIGITPFYSIIKHKTQTFAKQPLYLFYGNQSQEAAAYFDELNWFQSNNPHFTFIPTFIESGESWLGARGYINHTLIKKYITDLQLPIFYLCGSPSMVLTLRETLLELDVPETHIKWEDFPGY